MANMDTHEVDLQGSEAAASNPSSTLSKVNFIEVYTAPISRKPSHCSTQDQNVRPEM
ncbi:hypothetical protein EG327_001006, partial [Venturia inaequalis]